MILRLPHRIAYTWTNWELVENHFSINFEAKINSIKWNSTRKWRPNIVIIRNLIRYMIALAIRTTWSACQVICPKLYGIRCTAWTSPIHFVWESSGHSPRSHLSLPDVPHSLFFSQVTGMRTTNGNNYSYLQGDKILLTCSGCIIEIEAFPSGGLGSVCREAISSAAEVEIMLQRIDPARCGSCELRQDRHDLPDRGDDHPARVYDAIVGRITSWVDLFCRPVKQASMIWSSCPLPCGQC